MKKLTILLLTALLAACSPLPPVQIGTPAPAARSAPVILEVTRVVPVEVTREVTREITRVVYWLVTAEPTPTITPTPEPEGE